MCYGNETKNCEFAGRYYDKKTIAEICPQGWHVPTQVEWEVLIETVGGFDIAEKMLKSNSGWKFDSTSNAGTDDYGFSAIPAGYMFKPADDWIYQDRMARFLSSQERICLNLSKNRVYLAYEDDWPPAASVRCIKNEK